MVEKSAVENQEAAEKNWGVYMIEASDGSLYTGITTDIQRRWSEHAGGKKGAKYFRGRSPKALVYFESGFCRSEATKLEAAIKKLNKPGKLRLIAMPKNEVEQIAWLQKDGGDA